MSGIYIYTEGIADVKFLKDFIEYNFFNKEDLQKLDTKNREFKNDQYKFSIKSIDGIGNLEKIINSVKEKSDAGMEILFIFDADRDINNGGFSVRKEEVEKILQTYSIENYEIFLFPNNENDGDLEDLLSSIINAKNNGIFECWDGYENCLSNKEGNYTLPARKTKVYAYLEALLGKTNDSKKLIKEENRNYKNEDHWTLNHKKAEPLKIFLEKYFSGISQVENKA